MNYTLITAILIWVLIGTATCHFVYSFKKNDPKFIKSPMAMKITVFSIIFITSVLGLFGLILVTIKGFIKHFLINGHKK